MKLSQIRLVMIITAALSMMIGLASCKKDNHAEETKTQQPDTTIADNAKPEAEEAKNIPADTQEIPSATEPAAPQANTLPAYHYPGNDRMQEAITNYITHVIAKDFSPADVCIPSMTIVATDASNPDDILVWGDYWVFNYKLDNDTLLTESGGSYPGLIHLKKVDDDYQVTKMDPVADGSDNLKSAKEIFGDKYEDFHKINSNQDEREKVRRQFISDYVKANKLPITKVKDSGWDPVELPSI